MSSVPNPGIQSNDRSRQTSTTDTDLRITSKTKIDTSPKKSPQNVKRTVADYDRPMAKRHDTTDDGKRIVSDYDSPRSILSKLVPPHQTKENEFKSCNGKTENNVKDTLKDNEDEDELENDDTKYVNCSPLKSLRQEKPLIAPTNKNKSVKKITPPSNVYKGLSPFQKRKTSLAKELDSLGEYNQKGRKLSSASSKSYAGEQLLVQTESVKQTGSFQELRSRYVNLKENPESKQKEPQGYYLNIKEKSDLSKTLEQDENYENPGEKCFVSIDYEDKSPTQTQYDVPLSRLYKTVPARQNDPANSSAGSSKTTSAKFLSTKDVCSLENSNSINNESAYENCNPLKKSSDSELPQSAHRSRRLKGKSDRYKTHTGITLQVTADDYIKMSSGKKVKEGAGTKTKPVVLPKPKKGAKVGYSKSFGSINDIENTTYMNVEELRKDVLRRKYTGKKKNDQKERSDNETTSRNKVDSTYLVPDLLRNAPADTEIADDLNEDTVYTAMYSGVHRADMDDDYQPMASIDNDEQEMLKTRTLDKTLSNNSEPSEPPAPCSAKYANFTPGSRYANL